MLNFYSKMLDLVVSPFRVLRRHISLNHSRNIHRDPAPASDPAPDQGMPIDVLIIRRERREPLIVGNFHRNALDVSWPSIVRELNFKPRYNDLPFIQLDQHFSIINTEGCTISLTPLMELKCPVTFFPSFPNAYTYIQATRSEPELEGSHHVLQKQKLEIFEYESLLNLWDIYRDSTDYSQVNGFAQGGKIPPPCYWQRCRPIEIERCLKGV
jgi:hypothetical protein